MFAAVLALVTLVDAGSVSAPFSFEGVIGSQGRALFVHSYEKVLIYDVSTPLAPRLEGQMPLPDDGYADPDPRFSVADGELHVFNAPLGGECLERGLTIHHWRLSETLALEETGSERFPKELCETPEALLRVGGAEPELWLSRMMNVGSDEDPSLVVDTRVVLADRNVERRTEGIAYENPQTDGTYVYAVFGSGGSNAVQAFARDAEGKPVPFGAPLELSTGSLFPGGETQLEGTRLYVNLGRQIAAVDVSRPDRLRIAERYRLPDGMRCSSFARAGGVFYCERYPNILQLLTEP